MKKNEVAALTAIVSARLGALSMRARFLCLLGALAAAAIGVENASAQPNEDGVWSTLRSWPLIAVHTVMTPDGRVLTYGTKADGSQTGLFIYDVWDPSAGLAAGTKTN